MPRLDRVWQLAPGGAEEPDVLYAGVEPAALFRSADGGHTFELVRPLWDHPHRAEWNPVAAASACTPCSCTPTTRPGS